MSDSMIVFVNSKKLPTVNGLRSAVKELGLELESWGEDSIEDLGKIEGFWPGVFKGESAGFEFFSGEIEDDDLESWGVDRSCFSTQDYMVDLTYYDEFDVVAAALCAAMFCKMSDGLTFDTDDELSINSSNCDNWVNKLIDEIVK